MLKQFLQTAFGETGLILRCAGKVRNPFQTKQGNRPSHRDQEGIRGSEQAVHRTLVFPSKSRAQLSNFTFTFLSAPF